MKWMLLLVLVSCGKNITPPLEYIPKKDEGQTSIIQEESLNKYLATVEPLGEMTGKMTILAGESVKENYSYEFTNKKDLIRQNFNKMIQPLNLSKMDDFFSEWEKLLIINDTQLTPRFSQNFYEVKLLFTHFQSGADEITYRNGLQSRSLGVWKQNLTIMLSKNEIKSILNGSASFSLKKKQKEEIEKKTYRIYFFDGTKASVMYVSKKLSFDKFLDFQNILSPQEIDLNNLFFSDHSNDPIWWQRILPDGSYVLILATLTQLKNMQLKSFKHQRKTISRVDGVSESVFYIKKDFDALLYLKIRAERIQQNFKTSKSTKYYNVSNNASPFYKKCLNTERKLSRQKPILPTLDYVLHNLSIKSHGVSINTSNNDDVTIMEKHDEHGIYWEILIHIKKDLIQLKLNNRSSSTYVRTGLYKVKCNKGKSPEKLSRTWTNKEAKFGLDIDAYVENLN